MQASRAGYAVSSLTGSAVTIPRGQVALDLQRLRPPHVHRKDVSDGSKPPGDPRRKINDFLANRVMQVVMGVVIASHVLRLT